MKNLLVKEYYYSGFSAATEETRLVSVAEYIRLKSTMYIFDGGHYLIAPIKFVYPNEVQQSPKHGLVLGKKPADKLEKYILSAMASETPEQAHKFWKLWEDEYDRTHPTTYADSGYTDFDELFSVVEPY